MIGILAKYVPSQLWLFKEEILAEADIRSYYHFPNAYILLSGSKSPLLPLAHLRRGK
jgi:hypothetical protein